MTFPLFSDLDLIDSALNFLNGQKANVTANYPAGPIKDSVLAELNAEIAFYTALQASEVAALSNLLSGGAPPPASAFTLSTVVIGHAQLAAGGSGSTISVPIVTMPPYNRIIASYIRQITGFNDAGGHGYSINCVISDGIVGQAVQNVNETGTEANSFVTGAAENGKTNTPAPIPVAALFDYGGNALGNIVSGSCICSVIYGPME